MIVNVPLDNLIPNSHQPKSRLDVPNFEAYELATDILKNGLAYNPKARERKDQLPVNDFPVYEMADGWRRLAAYRWLLKNGHYEFDHIPVDIVEYSDRQMAAIIHSANDLHKPMTFIERAEYYQQYLTDWKLTQGELAEIMGVSQGEIGNTIRMLHCPPFVLDRIISQEITETHGRHLLRLNDNPDAQKKLLADCIKGQWSANHLANDIAAYIFINSKNIDPTEYPKPLFDIKACEQCDKREKLGSPYANISKTWRCTNPTCWKEKQGQAEAQIKLTTEKQAPLIQEKGPIENPEEEIDEAAEWDKAKQGNIKENNLKLRSPSGPLFEELLKVGDMIKTNYGTGPYIVESMSRVSNSNHPCWGLILVGLDAPKKKDGTYPKNYERSYINELVAVNGRILKLFEANKDEVFIIKNPDENIQPASSAAQQSSIEETDKPKIIDSNKPKSLIPPGIRKCEIVTDIECANCGLQTYDHTVNYSFPLGEHSFEKVCLKDYYFRQLTEAVIKSFNHQQVCSACGNLIPESCYLTLQIFDHYADGKALKGLFSITENIICPDCMELAKDFSKASIKEGNESQSAGENPPEVSAQQKVLKSYRLQNRTLNYKYYGEDIQAESPEAACAIAGWKYEDCHIKEQTKGSGWKFVTPYGRHEIGIPTVEEDHIENVLEAKRCTKCSGYRADPTNRCILHRWDCPKGADIDFSAIVIKTAQADGEPHILYYADKKSEGDNLNEAAVGLFRELGFKFTHPSDLAQILKTDFPDMPSRNLIISLLEPVKVTSR